MKGLDWTRIIKIVLVVGVLFVISIPIHEMVHYVQAKINDKVEPTTFEFGTDNGGWFRLNVIHERNLTITEIQQYNNESFVREIWAYFIQAFFVFGMLYVIDRKYKL